MKPKNIRRAACALAAAGALLLAPSCLKETASGPEGIGNAANRTGEQVDVSLGLRVAVEQDGTAERSLEYGGTKALTDIEDPSCIRNLWILQYNGTGDDAILIGNPIYLDNVHINAGNTGIEEIVRLIEVDGTSTVFFIANTFNKDMVFPGTISELTNMSMAITEQNDLFGCDGTDHHIIFSGWSTLEQIVSGCSISASLSRNIAKLTLHVVNSTFSQSDKVTVNGVSLHSIPDKSFYFPTYGSPETRPRAGEFSTIEYPLVPWTGTEDQSTQEASCDFVFYAPVNRRGTVPNYAPSAKGRYNPGNATFVTLPCSYMDGGEESPIIYTFYLGANLVNDFNIESNRDYTYTINIRTKGDVNADYRITDYGTVDFTLPGLERSNCYILNPPEVEDFWRTYKIPVDRVNTFWGKTSVAYENNGNYQLNAGTQWEASVIWSDFEYDKSNFRFQGGGTTYSGTGTDPIIVQTKKGARGNVLIGIRRKTGDNYTPWLWSWHLWITDYSPDEVYKLGIQPQASVFDYAVTGGKVHRLGGTMWSSGIYSSSFIMDRNVGALDAGWHDQNNPGVIYYQFGRKDPLYYLKSYTTISRDNDLVKESEEVPANSVWYSIAHPNVFITSSSEYWTKGNKYNPDPYDANILWNDPQATKTNHAKSIFDPCPMGWKLPESGAYSAFNATSFPWSSYGRTYKDTNFFPAFSHRRNNGSIYDVGSLGYYWYSSPGSVTNSWGLNFAGGGVYPSYSYHSRVLGYSVRCVKE